MAKKYVEGKAAPLKKNQVRVQAGDSLWKLAQKYTGNGMNWSKLNGGNKLIKPGDVIDVPENLWNPEIMVDGKPMRWRSEEYRKAYPNLVDTGGGRTLEEVTATPKNKATRQEKYEKRRNELNYQTGMDMWGTVLNAADMPRRMVAATTSAIRGDDKMSYGDALQFFGWQPYKSVVSDEYEKAHPTASMLMDIGAGVAAVNAPGIAKNVAENAPRLATNIMRTARVSAPRLEVPVQELSYQAGKGAAGSTKTNWLKQGANRKLAGTKSGATGKPNVASRGVGGGSVKAGQTPRGAVTQAEALPVNLLPYEKPGFIPYPGLWLPPAKPITPVPVQTYGQRIETETPWQVSLDQLIRENKVAPGDTLVMPNGEEIKYVLPEEKTKFNPRMIDVTSTNIYDASKVAKDQFEVPGRREKTFGVQKKSADKYYPAVPKGEKRGKKTYPYIINGKASYKPLQ